MKDETEIRVQIFVPGRDVAAYSFSVSRHEMEDFGLRPMRRPISEDYGAMAEWQQKMAARRDRARNIGERIAFAFMKYFEEREEA